MNIFIIIILAAIVLAGLISGLYCSDSKEVLFILGIIIIISATVVVCAAASSETTTQKSPIPIIPTQIINVRMNNGAVISSDTTYVYTFNKRP